MISDKPWSVQAVIRLFLAVIITYCLVMMLTEGLGKLNLGLSSERLLAWQMVGGDFLIDGTTLGWIALFLRLNAISWTNAFGFNQSKPLKIALYGMVVGALFLPIGWGLQTLSVSALQQSGVDAEEQVVVQELQNPKVPESMKIALGVLAVVVAPVAEEALFRGIIYTALRQRFRRSMAWWVTSVLFAAMHFNAASFLPLLVFAMILIFLYETYGNLLCPIMAHFIFNGANFGVLMFQDKLDQIFQRLLHLT